MKEKTKRRSSSEIHDMVAEKFESRSALVQHFVAYLLVNMVLWSLYWFSSRGFPWPIFISAFWGIGMLNHYWSYYYKYGKGAEKRDAEIAAELMKQRHHQAEGELGAALVYGPDNFERRGLRLSDDGELLDWETDEDQQLRQQQL